MASSSTASIQKSFTYDVFLSFRGEDTRTKFLDHLYNALKQKGIYTYKDDEAIRKGERISDELMRSIEDSKFYIIVFSKNYASSSWCLDELVKIMECQKTTEHTAYPVFYDVEPSEVRKQSGAVGEAFTKHENHESAGKWREALAEAADLAGWELRKTANGHEAEFIKKIVKEISTKLDSICFSIDKKLVGMEPRVKNVLSSLETDSDDVRMIGIWGIGGGGKTTLARVVFDKISGRFDSKSFVENIREVSNNPVLGLKSLQKQVLSNVLNDPNIKVDGIHDGKAMMKKKMCGQRVLLVLDDVDQIEQLRALACHDWFKSGSRIIITTRDKQVLEAHRVKLIVNVKLLSYEEQKRLFNTYAFEGEIPIQGYEELSEQVINYAHGLPLTIKVLGSLLCGEKDKSEWRDTLERLKKIPLHETLKILELSYESLEEDYKQIFLDVACMLKGWPEDLVIEALESRGFYAKNGLRVLQKKSLITIQTVHDYDYGYSCKQVSMHDHIEEMGKNIVHRSHPKPKKHSRLWIDEEIKKILANDSGTKATRCVQFYTEKVNPEIMKGFIKMKELRFLSMCVDNTDCFASNVNQCFPEALQYLLWYKYPFMFLPKTFGADNLVSLSLEHSKIVHLWEGGERKVLNKLKYLDLSYSKLTILDLRLIPNLKALSLRGCLDLVELHVPVGCLELIKVDLSNSKLKTVDLHSAVNLNLLYLENCNALVELHLPDGCLELTYLECTTAKLMTLDIHLARKLETLIFGASGDLVKLQMPDECQNLRSLKLIDSTLRTFDISLTPNLEDLDLSNCCHLEELSMTNKCPNLKSLRLNNSKLRTLDIGLTPKLENLDLNNCYNLEELRMAAKCLNLISLQLTNSKLKTLDTGLTPNLEYLDLSDSNDLEDLSMANKCVNLKFVQLTNSKLRSLDIGFTPNLEYLDLSNCCDLEELNMAAKYPNLETLHLTNSKVRTLDIGLTPNLEHLDLSNSNALEELCMAAKCPNLISLQLTNSKLRTFDTGLTPNLEYLDLTNCRDLEEFNMAAKCPKLNTLQLTNSKLRTLDIGLALDIGRLILYENGDLEKLQIPGECLNLGYLKLTNSKLRTLDIGLAPNLEDLDLRNCSDLEELNMVDKCQKLKSLTLTNSKLRTLDIGLAPNLEKLILYGNDDFVKLQIPGECLTLKFLKLTNRKLRTLDIRLTPNLKDLDLRNCSNLEELHMADKCQKLESLNIMHSKLRTLDIGQIPNLKSLSLNNCYNLEELQMGGECQKLVFLNISHSKLKILDLGLTPNLRNLDLKECNNLVQVHAPAGCLENLVSLDLSGCLRFTSFLEKKNGASSRRDESLEVGPLAELHLIAKSLKKCPLHPENALRKFQFECFYKGDPSVNTNLETLISEGLCACTNLETFSRSIFQLRRLRKLQLEGYPEAPKDLGQLECLEELSMSTTSMTHIPDTICLLKHLKILELGSCWFLEKLPGDLGQLECLERLTLSSRKIKHLPDSICMLKHLKALDLDNCFMLEKLPEDFGRLECLEKLSLSTTNIKHVPDSFCMLKHLKVLVLSRCYSLEELPEGLGLLERLVTLQLSYLKIKHLPDTICMLKHLEYLDLGHCSFLEKLPEDLDRLQCLERLNLQECKSLADIPNSICTMKCLKELDVSGTCISHLPHNIRSFKGLYILGSRGLLQSSGFTSEIRTVRYGDACFVDV